MSSLSELFKTDDEYKKFKRILSTVREAAKVTETKKEATFMHSQRGVRSVKVKTSITPSKLQEILLQEIAARSRLVELKSAVINQVDLVESAIRVCKNHLAVKYSAQLTEVGKTLTDRKQVLDKVFANAKIVLDELNTVNEMLDLFIKDIDSAGYALSNVRETLKLILDKRETV